MNLSYDKSFAALQKFIFECINKIDSLEFTDCELQAATPIKYNLIKNNAFTNISLSDSIKFQRRQMIKQKINHTLRVVSDVYKMSSKMNADSSFTELLKIAALLHDVGRFDQATWNNSFSDMCYKNIPGINNHADAGYELLKSGRIDEYGIPKKYHKAILQVVKHHGDSILSEDLSYKISNIEKELLVKKYISYSTSFTESEKIIISTLVQMVRDVDMLDILYQHLTGEFPVVRDSIEYDVEDDSLLKISDYFGIYKEEIIKYNGLKSDNLEDIKTIKIPVENIDISKLIVAKDIQDRFFEMEDLDLKELQKRRDWTFIAGMWWRLNHFLLNINFVSNLMIIEESKLLDRIYEMYPDKYKPLVKDAFEYSKEIILKKGIEDTTKNQIYTIRRNKDGAK